MTVHKAAIIKNITKESMLSLEDASKLLESFLSSIKDQSKENSVKFSGFGSFSFKKTPSRIGRNPKTKDSYIIPLTTKLNFKPSNKTKGKIN